MKNENTIDQRVWKSPNLGQNPAPQANRNAPPDADSDPIFSRGNTANRSKSPVSGHAGIHHLDGEKNQYFHTLEGGLQTRAEGTRQHEFNATADAEPLDPKTIAEVSRGKYQGDQQGGNQHKAAQFGSDLSTGSQTRLGQGKQADNKLEDCGGYGR